MTLLLNFFSPVRLAAADVQRNCLSSGLFADTARSPSVPVQRYILMWKSTRKILKIGKMKQPWHRLVTGRRTAASVRGFLSVSAAGRPDTGRRLWITVGDKSRYRFPVTARAVEVIHTALHAVHRKGWGYPHACGIFWRLYTESYTGYPQFAGLRVIPLSTGRTGVRGMDTPYSKTP